MSAKFYCFYLARYWFFIVAFATPSIGYAGADCSDTGSARGAWLSGAWGVRIALPGGNRKNLIERFKSNALIDQLTALKTPRWVMLNLTEPAFGSMYTSPFPELNKNVSDLMTPDFDLLGYYIDLLRKNNYKIIVYFASQGPSLDYLSGKEKKLASLKKRRPKFFHEISVIDEKWHSYLDDRAISNHQATANIISYYSSKFGKKIDGWWFDHGKWGDARLFAKAARSGNSDAIVAWNGQHVRGYAPSSLSLKNNRKRVWMLTKSGGDTDYTDGHISLTRYNPPWWTGNEQLVAQVENCDYIGGARPHIFSPLQSTWRGGSDVFPENIATDWTNRVVRSGGAITWAAALQPPEFTKPAIWDKSYDVLQAIDSSIISHIGVSAFRNNKPVTD